MAEVKEVGTNVFAIDDELYSIHGAGTVYFLTGEQKALVDCGPATSLKPVSDGIEHLGYDIRDLDYIIVTHIHLDHSGGVGTLLKLTPGAKVIAHQKAAKHLVDPSKLIISAIGAQGQSTVDRNGEVLPVPRERIMPVKDGDQIRLSSNQTLTVLETPGHAPHELCILESLNRGVFVGDAVGHYVEGTSIIAPITPPPSFDFELYLKSLKRLVELEPSRIYFAHAGCSDRAREKLEQAIRELEARNAVIENAVRSGRIDSVVEILTEHIRSRAREIEDGMKDLYEDWANNDFTMSAAEHVRYYRSKRGI